MIQARRSILLLLLLSVLLTGCDYVGVYSYFIENKLSNETVTVKTHRVGYRYPTEIPDSVFVILPKETKLINNIPTSPLGKHDHPYDIMADLNELGHIEIFINDVKLEKNLWERKYWEYTTEARKGTYLLVIDEQIIK